MNPPLVPRIPQMRYDAPTPAEKGLEFEVPKFNVKLQQELFLDLLISIKSFFTWQKKGRKVQFVIGKLKSLVTRFPRSNSRCN